MSVNLDNDLAIYNATTKADHPAGVEMLWTHDGKELRVVYQQLTIPEISDWGNRVRAFVSQVKRDKELRARRDKELAASEAEQPAQQQTRSGAGTGNGSDCNSEARAAVGGSSPPRSTNPLEYMQQQLQDTQNKLAELLPQVAQLEQHAAMLEAAVAAMKGVTQETGNDEEREGTKAARPAGKRKRKVRAKKTRVQRPAESSQDREAGAGSVES